MSKRTGEYLSFLLITVFCLLCGKIIVACSPSNAPAAADPLTEQSRMFVKELAYQGCIARAAQLYGRGAPAIQSYTDCANAIDSAMAGGETDAAAEIVSLPRKDAQ